MTMTKNDALSVEELANFAVAAGATAAAGNDSFIKLGLAVFKAKAFRTLSEGDIGPIYMGYLRAASAGDYTMRVDEPKANANSKKDSFKAGKSKLMLFFKLAKQGRDQFKVVGRAVQMVERHRAANGLRVKTGSHTEIVLKAIRATIKQGRTLDNAELETALFPPKADRTILEELEAMHGRVLARIDQLAGNVHSQDHFAAIANAIAARVEIFKAAELAANEADADDEMEALEAELDADTLSLV